MLLVFAAVLLTAPRFENRGGAAPCVYPTMESGETFLPSARRKLYGDPEVRSNSLTCLAVK